MISFFCFLVMTFIFSADRVLTICLLSFFVPWICQDRCRWQAQTAIYLMNKTFYVYCNTGAHGAGHGQTPQVSTFCRCRLGLDDGVNEFLAIGCDLVGSKR